MRANLRAATLVLAAAGFTSAAQAVQVDVAVLADDASISHFGGQAQTKAAMVSWVQQMNFMMVNSRVDISWRLVGVGYRKAPGGWK